MKNDLRFIAFIFMSLLILGCVERIVQIQTKIEYKTIRKCAQIENIPGLDVLHYFNKISEIERTLLDKLPEDYHQLIAEYKDSHFRLELALTKHNQILENDRLRNIEIISCLDKTIKKLTEEDKKDGKE